MKISMSSKIIEYHDIPSIESFKCRNPDSNVKQVFELDFLKENSFFFLNNKIYYESKSKKYGLWKERIPLDLNQPIEGVDLVGKVLLCVLKPKSTRNTRIFVTENSFIFEETLKHIIVKYLSQLEKEDIVLFKRLIGVFQNYTFNGPKIGKDAAMLTNFLVASHVYKVRIEDIVRDYELFKNIIAAEILL